MKNNLLRILTYHRVADPAKNPELNPRIISATPTLFAAQMRYLSGSYNVVSMEQALDAILFQRTLPERAVLITFDDGYFDFKDVAWPILKKLNLPATVFVPTSYPGESNRFFWWDKLYAAFTQTTESNLQIAALDLLSLGNREQRMQSLKLVQNHVKTLPNSEAMELVDDICKRLGVEGVVKQATMDWDQLRTLANEGVTLGAHTRTHPLLTRLTVDAAREEIKNSYKDLKREIGDILPVFAYPNGNHDQDIVDILIQEQLKLAVTVIDGFNDINTADPLRLHRTEVTQRTSLMLFRIRLQKWFSYVDKWRHRKKHLEQQVSNPVSNTPAI
jgi:peptidoglycan/xylan/chitin deacetylase (PgdA/CDA1 family)